MLILDYKSLEREEINKTSPFAFLFLIFSLRNRILFLTIFARFEIQPAHVRDAIKDEKAKLKHLRNLLTLLKKKKSNLTI